MHDLDGPTQSEISRRTSDHRVFIEPLLGYLQGIIESRQPDETITIVVPQFIPARGWQNTLHMRTADLLRTELLSRSGVVVIDVPYRLVENGKVHHHERAEELE